MLEVLDQVLYFYKEHIINLNFKLEIIIFNKIFLYDQMG